MSVKLQCKRSVATFDIRRRGLGAFDQQIDNALRGGEFMPYAGMAVHMVGELLEMKDGCLGKDQCIHNR